MYFFVAAVIGRCPVTTAWDSVQDLSQFPPQNFPGRGFRDAVNKTNLPWLLIVGQTIGDEARDVLFHLLRRDRTISKHDKCYRNLASVGVGAANHSTLAHRRMLEQDCFRS